MLLPDEVEVLLLPEDEPDELLLPDDPDELLSLEPDELLLDELLPELELDGSTNYGCSKSLPEAAVPVEACRWSSRSACTCSDLDRPGRGTSELRAARRSRTGAVDDEAGDVPVLVGQVAAGRSMVTSCR